MINWSVRKSSWRDRYRNIYIYSRSFSVERRTRVEWSVLIKPLSHFITELHCYQMSNLSACDASSV